MQLTDYLGQHLKSDDVMKLLDACEMDVVYRFDRTHENIADSDSASAESAGFELGFDAAQRRKTIWCHTQPRDGFTPVMEAMIGVPVYHAFSEARSATAAAGLATSEARDGAGSAWNTPPCRCTTNLPTASSPASR